MNAYFYSILAVNILVALAGIFAFRQMQGLTFGVNVVNELSKKDNYAFGLSFAGGAYAFSLIIAAAVAGEAADSWINEALNIVMYAVVGLVLLKIGSVLFDALIFNRFSVRKEVLNENLGAGIVQMGNFVALGIIVAASIDWVESETYEGLLIVVFNFIAAQVTLLIVTRIRARIYMSRHNKQRLQDAIADGNYALAIRYAGHIVAAAIAIASVGAVIPYFADAPWMSAAFWFIGGLVAAILITVLAGLAGKVILLGINVVQEVDEQKNYGVAMIEGAIFIAVAKIVEPVLIVADNLL